MSSKRGKTKKVTTQTNVAGRVIRLTAKQKESFDRIMRATRTWSSKHQWEIGVAEMAAGAGLIALGVNTGVIEMGKESWERKWRVITRPP